MGLPAFQLPMFAKCDALPKKESIPAITFWISKHPLPTKSFRLLRAAAGSTSSALCLHYACTRSHAFVEDSGFASHAEKHNRSGHGVVVSKVSYGTEYWNMFFYHLPCPLLKCVEIVATVGWKWGCRPFSWTCSLRNSKHRGS